MKKNKLSIARLQLNKEKITNLSNEETNLLLGGTSGTSSQRCIQTMNSSACPPPEPIGFPWPLTGHMTRY